MLMQKDLLPLSGCTYTLDGLKPDELTELSPRECPQIEGWFAAQGEVRYSLGAHFIRLT